MGFDGSELNRLKIKAQGGEGETSDQALYCVTKSGDKIKREKKPILGEEKMEYKATPAQIKLAEEKTKYDARKKRSDEQMIQATPVIIKGVDIPFRDLFELLIKVSVAAVPAGFVVFGIWKIIFSVLEAIL